MKLFYITHVIFLFGGCFFIMVQTYYVWIFVLYLNETSFYFYIY